MHSHRRRSIIAVLFSAALALAAAACGSGNGNNDGGTTAAPASQAPDSPAVPGSPVSSGSY